LADLTIDQEAGRQAGMLGILALRGLVVGSHGTGRPRDVADLLQQLREQDRNEVHRIS